MTPSTPATPPPATPPQGPERPDGRESRKAFARPTLAEYRRLTDALRAETLGGVLLLAAAILALVWANTPLSDSYATVSDFHFGPGFLGLNLSVQHWAADGLLAIFFFVAGAELKRELVAGDLRDPKAALLPVVAAACGMLVPALVYALVNVVGDGKLGGWAVPTATDIAFALAVLAVLGRSLPSPLRAFLLTLAVVDDLGAILIIAIFFTSDLNFLALAGAAAGLLVFWVLLRKEVRGWYVYVPLALVIWGLMYNSGVHATIAGVAMGLMLRCTRKEGEDASPGERVEHRVRPLSAGLAVPLFALFSAGVSVSGGALADIFTRPETLGVVLGLVVGKAVGVFGGTWLTVRFTRASLSDALAWADVFAVSVLAGIGFTVSLLIGELAFTDDPGLTDEVKAAVLVGSLIAVLLASVLLRMRNGAHRRLIEEEERDEDEDGVPDVYQEDSAEHHLRLAAVHEREAAVHVRKAAEHRALAARCAQNGQRDAEPDAPVAQDAEPDAPVAQDTSDGATGVSPAGGGSDKDKGPA